MKPPADDADARLWGVITATVRPLRSRHRPRVAAAAAPATPAVTPPPPSAPPGPARTRAPHHPPHAPAARKTPPRPHLPPQPIEPGRRRRIDRGHEPPAAVVDLHGLNQDQARAALTGFILRGWSENRRTILVITGKGALGDGVLRRRVPEWLGEPPLRQIVAGLSEAHRRHGGEGAIYVALKRADPR